MIHPEQPAGPVSTACPVRPLAVIKFLCRFEALSQSQKGIHASSRPTFFTVKMF